MHVIAICNREISRFISSLCLFRLDGVFSPREEKSNRNWRINDRHFRIANDFYTCTYIYDIYADTRTYTSHHTGFSFSNMTRALYFALSFTKFNKSINLFPAVSGTRAVSPLRELSKIHVHEGNDVSIHSHRERSRKPREKKLAVSLIASVALSCLSFLWNFPTRPIASHARCDMNLYERNKIHDDAESPSPNRRYDKR